VNGRKLNPFVENYLEEPSWTNYRGIKKAAAQNPDNVKLLKETGEYTC
jgi:hypothetical protein